MTISEDTSNQPSPVHSTTTTATSGSFSPQANTLVVICLAVDGATGTATTPLMTDSLSSTYTLLKRQNTMTSGVGGSADVWCRYFSSAPGSITVTGTWTATGQPAGNLTVRCLLGCDPSQTGATAGTGGGTVTPTATLTPTVIGSWIYGAGLDYTTNTTLTANANSTIIDQFIDSTNGDTWATFKGSAATSALTSTAYGFGNASNGFNVAIAEILPLAVVSTPMMNITDNVTYRSTIW